ncbi:MULTISPECIES: helix-turn-helix domain-containing protein [Cytobacillus]|nr:helix-turn-helix domain-containing protein [Cytobacillus firmus]
MYTQLFSNKYNPSLELALKLIEYFDVPIEELFYLEKSKGDDGE